MAANGNLPALGGPGTRISSLIRGLIAAPRARKLFRFFSLHDDRGPPQRGEPSEQTKMMKASEYLEICQENALDAHTVEDALYWHNEIITELSIELNLVEATRWPANIRANMRAQLEDRLHQHATAVTRLAAVV